MSEDLTLDDKMPLPGDAAPPMANGEVIFEEPWQSRTFGMARVLCEQGQFDWDEFRACLIEQISDWETTASEDKYQYFDHFLAALTDLLSRKNLCSDDELGQRAVTLAARPHGHDH